MKQFTKGYTVRGQVNHPNIIKDPSMDWFEVISDCSYQEAISVMGRLRRADPTRIKVRFFLVWPDGSETHHDRNWRNT